LGPGFLFSGSCRPDLRMIRIFRVCAQELKGICTQIRQGGFSMKEGATSFGSLICGGVT
jgi:hypothetical protein